MPRKWWTLRPASRAFAIYSALSSMNRVAAGVAFRMLSDWIAAAICSGAHLLYRYKPAFGIPNKIGATHTLF